MVVAQGDVRPVVGKRHIDGDASVNERSDQFRALASIQRDVFWAQAVGSSLKIASLARTSSPRLWS